MDEIQTEELLDLLKLTGTGIYQFSEDGSLRERSESYSGDPEVLQVFQANKPAASLAQAAAEACSVVLSHNESTSPGSQLPAIARDAAEVVNLSHAISKELSAERIRLDISLELAVKLGMAYQRMLVRNAEPHVLCGLKVVKGGKLAHAMLHGTEEEKWERWQAMYGRFTELTSDGMKAKPAYQLIARESRCAPKTVQRAVKRVRQRIAGELNASS